MSNVHPVISDLFFNHEHAEYAGYLTVHRDKHGYRDETWNEQDERAALLKDAEDFIKCYGSVLIDCPTAEELTEDFFNRI